MSGSLVFTNQVVLCWLFVWGLYVRVKSISSTPLAWWEKWASFAWSLGIQGRDGSKKGPALLTPVWAPFATLWSCWSPGLSPPRQPGKFVQGSHRPFVSSWFILRCWESWLMVFIARLCSLFTLSCATAVCIAQEETVHVWRLGGSPGSPQPCFFS